jgi:CspA family cold shock protein
MAARPHQQHMPQKPPCVGVEICGFWFFLVVFWRRRSSRSKNAPVGAILRRYAVVPATTWKDDNMATGTVKWFNPDKGFGFIQPDEGGKDVFVHISAVERAGLRTLADNQRIRYEMIEGRDGRQSAGELVLE